MKKIMQRFLGIVAAAALIVTYAVPVMATSGDHTHGGGTEIKDDPNATYIITLKEPDGVTIVEDKAHYGAYQIFSGTVKGTMPDGSEIPEEPGDTNEKIPITDIKWGNAFGDVTNTTTKDGDDGMTGKERWQSNIVKFVYALATASDTGKNPTYAYAFKGFDDFTDFAGDAENTLNAKYYTSLAGTVPTYEDYKTVDFDKLAIEVAEVLATKNDRQWLQMFADILGGYAQGEEGYAKTGYAVRYYESSSETDSEGKTTHKIKVPAGYYMIRDFSTIEEDETNSAFSARLLFVANNITQMLKSDIPTLEKNIIRKAVGDALTNPTTKDIEEWLTEAAGVGDTVKFQLQATLPSDYDNFLGGYLFTFKDTLSKGLTLTKDADKKITGLEITVVGAYSVTKDGTGKEINGDWYKDKPLTIATNSFEADSTHKHFDSDDKSAYIVKSEIVDGVEVLTVDFPCLKEIRIKDGSNTYRLGYKDDDEMSTIYVTYTAEVNSNAVVKPAVSREKNGNPNSAVLTYSDNPQAYTDTDFTTARSVTVYTYGVDITKVDAAEFIKANGNKDETGVPLEKAKFALVRENPDTTDNNYQIAVFEAADVAATSNPADPFGGAAYRSVVKWNDIDDTVDSDTTIQKITKDYVDKNSSAGTDTVNCTVTSAADGSINISGLNDDVDYYLVEVAPPDNTFATIDPFKFKLTAAISTANNEYTGLLAATNGIEIDKDETARHEITSTDPLSINHFVQVINASTDDENGIAELIVANFKYVDLPSTGGTGTYIFYIVGGVVVAASLVLFFISRKKTTK